MIRTNIFITLRTVFLAALLGAGAALAADNKDEVVSGGMPPMPTLGSMPDIVNLDSVTTKDPTRYQAGVRAYLNGKDEEAIVNLEEAVRLDAEDEKASRLLLKVLLRSINVNYERGDRGKARALVEKAYNRFPTNPEVKLLYASVRENRAAVRQDVSAGRPDTAPAKKSAAGRRAADASARAPAQILPPAALPAVSAPDTAQRENAPLSSADLRNYIKKGSVSISYAGVIGVIFFGMIIVISFVYSQHAKQDQLLRRMEELQKTMAERETASSSIRRELDIWKGFGKQVEELDLLRKTKEQVIHLELDKMRVEEERKLMADMAEKRREAERQARLELEARAALKAVPPEPEKVPPVPPKAHPKAVRESAADREDKILEILADIAPPEREAAWERIAVQSADLYAEAPEEAVKFFRVIAKDKDPLNRASIAGALAGIAAPETLEILMALYHDPGVDVRREALKRLDMLNKDASSRVNAEYREKIAACLSEEKEKGEWIF